MLEHYKNVRPYQSIRVTCPDQCGTDRSAIASSNENGFSTWCFRCGYKNFTPHVFQSLAELSAAWIAKDALANTVPNKVELPSDTTYDPSEWTREARTLLFKAGLYGDLLTDNKIGYSPSIDRIVLPTYQNGELVYLQQRAPQKGRVPKYLNPSVDRSNLIHWCVPRGDFSTVVLVEDIMSCIRVGQFIPTASLLGTKITVQQAGQLAKYKRVVTWLDSDKAGIDGASKVRKTVGLLCDTDNIVTKDDPKLLSNNQIQHELRKFLE